MTQSEDFRLIVDTVEAYTAGEVAPAVSDIETTGVLGPLLTSLRRQGLLDLAIPVQRGGSGADLTTLMVALDRIARQSAAVADLISMVHTTQLALNATSSAGSIHVLIDSASVQLHREAGTWRLQGTAPRVHHAALADRFLLVVGETAVDVAADKVLVGPVQERTGMRGSDPRSVDVSGAVADDTILGAQVAHAARALRWLTTGSIAVGLGRRAMTEAVGYARGRQQFGTSLMDMPAIRTILTSMKQQLEGADGQLVAAAQAPEPAGSGLAAASAMSAACAVTIDAIQVHGGYGYISEYPVERLLRDSLSLRASLGGTRVLRRPASLELAGRGR